MVYNWQLHDWPNFEYQLATVQDALYSYMEKAGRLAGRMGELPLEFQRETALELMVSEAIKTSAIEGEYLSRDDVMSSLRNALGLNKPTLDVKDDRAQGVARLLLHVRETFKAPLAATELQEWHSLLFPSSPPWKHLLIGAWRTDPSPMQVVSGSMGHIKIHFEAPPSDRIPMEMERFHDWFNRTAPGETESIRPGPLRAAIAHIYFESLHPFDDGNGRLGRAISDKALAQDFGAVPLLSLSQAIEAQKRRYYDALKEAQKSNEITGWIHYFVHMLLDAQDLAERQVKKTIFKTRLFDRFGTDINKRQAKALTFMLEDASKDFENGITAKKYMHMTHCSKATATRDLTALLKNGVLKKSSTSGRSTRYEWAEQ
jgi:Fic family protein